MADETAAEVYDYDRLLYRCPISYPYASDKPKLTKKVYSLINKAATRDKKRGVLKGIKDVTKAIRKNQKGIVVIGADVSPFDVVSHLPVMLEEAKVPYVWVPSRQDLGTATNCKRPTTVVLLRPHAEIESSFDKIVSAIEELNSSE